MRLGHVVAGAVVLGVVAFFLARRTVAAKPSLVLAASGKDQPTGYAQPIIVTITPTGNGGPEEQRPWGQRAKESFTSPENVTFFGTAGALTAAGWGLRKLTGSAKGKVPSTVNPPPAAAPPARPSTATGGPKAGSRTGFRGGLGSLFLATPGVVLANLSRRVNRNDVSSGPLS